MRILPTYVRFFTGLLAVSFALCLPALAGDEWRKKPADQWTEDDARQVLTDSPWAKLAKVQYIGGGGGASSPVPNVSRIPGTIPGGSPNPGGTRFPGGGGSGGERVLSPVTVRWQSASAIRLAFAKVGVQKLPDLGGAENSYVISAFGLREMGPEMIDPDDSTTLARIRDGARLLVGNKRSVIPKRVRASQREQGVTLFFIFPKEDLGPLADEKVKLLARVGPAQISAEFKTKDMKLDGKPDL